MGSAPLLIGVSFLPDLEKIGAFVTGAGFSVFVAVWYMVKHDRKLEELSLAIRELSAVLHLIHRIENPARGSGMREGVGAREI